VVAVNQTLVVNGSDANALRFVRSCIGAQGALAKEQPTSARGKTAQRLAVSVFGYFARAAREYVLSDRALNNFDFEAADRHRQREKTAVRKANAAARRLGQLIGLP
jgi:hypothetical protein